MKQIIKKIAFGLYILLQCGVVFIGGFCLYQDAKIRLILTAHMTENQYIDIDLPKGVRFTSFGGCYPRWEAPDDKTQPSWNHISCDVEKYDYDKRKFIAAPFSGGGFVEIKEGIK